MVNVEPNVAAQASVKAGTQYTGDIDTHARISIVGPIPILKDEAMIAISNGNHGVGRKFFFGGNKASASALFIGIVRLVIEGGHVLIL